jgi:hypothetical protein
MITGMDIFIGCGYGSHMGIDGTTLGATCVQWGEQSKVTPYFLFTYTNRQKINRKNILSKMFPEG